MTAAIAPVPLWTAPLREQTSGIDHLGLGSVGTQQILVRLVPDIYVLTLHPGYASFYSFVLDEFWRREHLPRTRASWIRFFRSKDLIFSIAGSMCEHASYMGEFRGIVGSGRTSGLAEAPPAGGYSTDFNYIKSPLGGFGLYYRAPFVELGLIYPAIANGYQVDLPTERGQELATSFRERIAETEYHRTYFDADHVPSEAVREYGEAACLCKLPVGSDRDQVRDIYLHGGPPPMSASRRASLRMVLDIAAQTSDLALDESRYRQLIYFRECEGSGKFKPSMGETTPDRQPETLAVWRRWRLYQAREFYAYALDGLWRWLVEWGLERDGDVQPVPLDEAIAALRASIDGAALDDWVHEDPAFSQTTKAHAASRLLSRAAGEVDMAPVEDPGWPDRSYSIDAGLTEWRLYLATDRGAASPGVLTTGSIALLHLIAGRFAHPAVMAREEWSFAHLGGVGRLSLHGFVTSIQRRFDRGDSVGDIAEWLLRDYVIAQHLRVAAGKLPFNTYRFVREGGRLRFFDRTRPIGMNSARFEALSYMMSDLDFVEPLHLTSHALTPDGETFLARGDWTA